MKRTKAMKPKQRAQFAFDDIPKAGYLHPYVDDKKSRVLELVSHRSKFEGEKEIRILLWMDWNTREVFTSGTKTDRLMDCSREMEEWASYRSDVYPSGKKNVGGARIVDAEGYSACAAFLDHMARGSMMGMNCESLMVTKDESGKLLAKLRLQGVANG